MINMNDANVKETAIEKITEKFLDLPDTRLFTIGIFFFT